MFGNGNDPLKDILDQIMEAMQGLPHGGKVRYWTFVMTSWTMRLPLFPDRSAPLLARFAGGLWAVLVWLLTLKFIPQITTSFITSFSNMTGEKVFKHDISEAKQTVRRDNRVMLKIINQNLVEQDVYDLMKHQKDMEAKSSSSPRPAGSWNDHGEPDPFGMMGLAKALGDQGGFADMAREHGMTPEQLSDIMDNHRCTECPLEDCPGRTLNALLGSGFPEAPDSLLRDMFAGADIEIAPDEPDDAGHDGPPDIAAE